jgi:hypothetical protein
MTDSWKARQISQPRIQCKWWAIKIWWQACSQTTSRRWFQWHFSTVGSTISFLVSYWQRCVLYFFLQLKKKKSLPCATKNSKLKNFRFPFRWRKNSARCSREVLKSLLLMLAMFQAFHSISWLFSA